MLVITGNIMEDTPVYKLRNYIKFILYLIMEI